MLLKGRVVYENVQLPKFLGCSSYSATTNLRLANIGFDQKRFVTFCFDRRLCFLASLFSWRRWVIATSAPSRANSTATARPMPESPPVISAALPLSLSAPL